MLNKPWLEFYNDDVPHEITVGDYQSPLELFDEAILAYADKPAFHGLGGSLSFAEIDRLSNAFASYLQQELGVKKGDRIALMCPNILAFPVASFGILRAGAVQVNVNPLYTPNELRHQLNDSGAEHIVIASLSTSVLAEILNETPINTVITVGLGDFGQTDVPTPPIDSRIEAHIAISEAVNTGLKTEYIEPDISGDDLIFLQYTGGTTGLSKGAMLKHRNVLANMIQMRTMLPEVMNKGEEIIINPLPLYHIFGLTVGMFTYFSIGAQNHLIADPRNIQLLVDALKTSRFTVLVGVNPLYMMLAAHPEADQYDLSNFKASVSGGAPTLKPVSEMWKKVTGRHILEGFGMSETSPAIAINPIYTEEFTGTVGLPTPSTDIIILDNDDNPLGINEPGEICVKGPQVFDGYWNKPELNDDAFTKGGYFRTGDIGLIDNHGRLKIVDRKKDMILVSGFNVFPTEIEDYVAHMPGVLECACIGVMDEKSGEAPKLFIVRQPSSNIIADDVIAYCREGLAGYKVPKHIEFVSSLPKSIVGKILRKELRAQDANAVG